MSLSPAKAPMPPLEDLSLIPGRTLLLVIMGDREGIPKLDSKRIFYNTSQIPLEDKDYIVLASDDYGYPPLIADHHAPLCDPSSILFLELYCTLKSVYGNRPRDS